MTLLVNGLGNKVSIKDEALVIYERKVTTAWGSRVDTAGFISQTNRDMTALGLDPIKWNITLHQVNHIGQFVVRVETSDAAQAILAKLTDFNIGQIPTISLAVFNFDTTENRTDEKYG